MKMKLNLLALTLSMLPACHSVLAAEAIDLRHQPYARLQGFMTPGKGLVAGQSQSLIKEIDSSTDFNQTRHVRVRQEFAGYPVWGSDAVVHIKAQTGRGLKSMVNPEVTMNGVIYDKLQADLAGTPQFVFTPEQAKKILAFAIRDYTDRIAEKFTTSQHQTQLMVYVDEEDKAHWAYQVSFLTSRIKHNIPARPVYIVDAVTPKVYRQWNNIKTRIKVAGGGIGGNPTMGKKIYDGLNGDMPALTFERDEKSSMCYLRNDSVIIKDVSNNEAIPMFKCESPDSKHNKIYWNTLNDTNNGGYSPDDDGIYSDMIVRDMYQKWFNIPMLRGKNGKPMRVTFHVHDPEQEQNAYYDNGEMVFGDGDDESYPVVAPSVVAHEMSHGFTEQHSNLIYDGQSGGINESFSDMADKAVEYFQYGKNNWELDPELLKEGGKIMRYMDEPTKDCRDSYPGQDCSISHTKDYDRRLNVHFSSGIFNKAFYLIATKWDTKKAFEVMTQANMHYWTADTTFEQAACGVIHATKDYGYDVQTVRDAMHQVGVDTSSC